MKQSLQDYNEYLVEHEKNLPAIEVKDEIKKPVTGGLFSTPKANGLENIEFSNQKD